jgi:hypothetical protein
MRYCRIQLKTELAAPPLEQFRICLFQNVPGVEARPQKKSFMAPQSYRYRCGKNLNGLFKKNCGTDMRHLPSPLVVIFSDLLAALCLLSSSMLLGFLRLFFVLLNYFAICSSCFWIRALRLLRNTRRTVTYLSVCLRTAKESWSQAAAIFLPFGNASLRPKGFLRQHRS